MFVDELTIQAKAGDGGDGVVRWLRLKYRPKAGPAGGNGGKGGDVFVRGVRNLSLLSKYTGAKEFCAKNGEPGRSQSQYGRGSNDIFIDVPVGSRITNLDNGREYFVNDVDQVECILKGGAGGLGNEHFKSSTNRSPQESTKGKPGERGTFKIEVLLTADVGLVGLPNAGKSSLLNSITNASSEVGAYPFTTTEPHLGALYEFVIADIPGLIEGAATGKGLGHKFLRHIERTQMLVHLVSLEETDPVISYETIRNELKNFDPELLRKEEWIILSKSDVVGEEHVEKIQKNIDKYNKRVFVLSQNNPDSIKYFQDELIKYLREK